MKYTNSDSTVSVTSTSSVTAAVDPIVLRETDTLRVRFLPVLVHNAKDEFKSVEGKIVYERKRKKDPLFPSDPGSFLDIESVSRKDVRSGDWLEINLSTSETFELMKGLKGLYKLYDDMGGIPSGSTKYVPVDSSYRRLVSLLESNPSSALMLMNQDNYELIRIFLDLITRGESLNDLRRILKDLEAGNLQKLSASINVEQLERAENDIEANLDNSDEEFWQKEIFAKYPWILSQIFATPCTIFEEKAYVGGKALDNTGGNICDFIYQNPATRNVSLIEIKTPTTQILGGNYRHTFSLSKEMSGAINQVLNYKDTLLKEFHELQRGTNRVFEVLSPICVVVIGNTKELGSNQAVSAFENYRNSLVGVTIITYDELLRKIKNLLGVLRAEGAKDDQIVDPLEECPF